MNLELTAQEVRILRIALDEFMDNDYRASAIKDLETAGRISFLLKQSTKEKNQK